MNGSGPLYDELHSLLEATGSPGPVHRFLAGLPRLARERGSEQPLLVTAGYDLALEQALLDAGEEFDVVIYLASGRHRGRFCHLAPDGSATPIESPNTYVAELALDRRPVVLKLYGRVDPNPGRQWESFVVSEDDYIGYLQLRDLAAALPVALAARLRRSHFLFLGYEMSDWHLRIVLNRLWEDRCAALPIMGGARAPGAARARALAPPRRRRDRSPARGVRRAARGANRHRPCEGTRHERERPLEAGPYRGLSPFGDSDLDALLFFGRERERAVLVANLLASRLTVLYGPERRRQELAVRAGVVHELRDADRP